MNEQGPLYSEAEELHGEDRGSQKRCYVAQEGRRDIKR